MASIRCAHCKARHATVAQVKACAANPYTFGPELAERYADVRTPVSGHIMTRDGAYMLLVADKYPRAFASQVVDTMAYAYSDDDVSAWETLVERHDRKAGSIYTRTNVIAWANGMGDDI